MKIIQQKDGNYSLTEITPEQLHVLGTIFNFAPISDTIPKVFPDQTAMVDWFEVFEAAGIDISKDNKAFADAFIKTYWFQLQINNKDNLNKQRD